MASYAFRITGLAPTDSAWHTAGEDVHRAFWREVVRLVLIEKDAELAAGKDRFGIDLVEIAESTRAKGRWRSHTGLGTADNPPLTPATILSRTRSLFTGRAKSDHAEFYWKFDEVSGKHWGWILGRHRIGNAGRNLPVRDVIGLSPRSLRRVQAGANKWWTTWKKNRERMRRLGEFELELPRTRPIPPRVKIVEPASIDLSRLTGAIGGDDEALREAIAEGRFSGFKLPGVKGRFMPPGAPPKPGTSPFSALPKPPKPKRPTPPVVTRPPRPIPGRPRGKAVKPPAAAPRPTKAAIEKQFGVTFQQSALEKTDTTIIVDVAKLDALLRRTTGHGSSHATPKGVEQFKAFLAKAQKEGIAIEQTRITIDSRGNPVIEEGRHRFATLRDLGATHLPISVPKSQAALFRRLFG